MQEEIPNITELSQGDRNEALLRNSELGVILHDAYLTATNIDPRLDDVVIVPNDSGDNRIAFARHKENAASGRYEVHLRLNDLDKSLALQEDILKNVQGARELFAGILGIEPDQVTPQLLHVFSILHEFGHITEYMDNEGNEVELQRRMRREKAALPIGNTITSKLLDPSTLAHRTVIENWEQISAQHGVRSMGDLIEKQHGAYRGMTSEHTADMFAVDVFATNTQLVDQLNADIEAYRSYGRAA